MAQTVLNEMTQEMVDFLQGDKMVFLSTVDHEKGTPAITCISWLLAISPTEIRFAIDPRSRVIQNIKQNPNLTLAFIGLSSSYSISGEGISDSSQLEGVTIKMTDVAVKVSEVHEIMFYGSEVSQEPQFQKTYNPALAEKFDADVYGALKMNGSK